MRDETARALAGLNRRFYERHAADFSGTRGEPWPGWERCRPFLLPPVSPVRVLDAGCGNGRLGAWLLAQSGSSVRYVGLDASPALLAEARRRLPADVRLVCGDLLAGGLAARLGDGFDAVALFGVLHHVPRRTAREALVRELARLLAPGGHLLATVWRADGFARFQSRFLPWTACEARTGVVIDPDDVEPGDVLLPWKHDPAALRYCHFPDEAEMAGWLDASGLPLRESFDADGREGELNRYWVLGPRDRSERG